MKLKFHDEKQVGNVQCLQNRLSIGHMTQKLHKELSEDSGNVENSNNVITGATWRSNRVAYASGFSTAFTLLAEDIFYTHIMKSSANKSKVSEVDEKESSSSTDRSQDNGTCGVTFMLQNYRQVAVDGAANELGASRIPNALRVEFQIQKSIRRPTKSSTTTKAGPENNQLEVQNGLEWRIQIKTPRGTSPAATIPLEFSRSKSSKNVEDKDPESFSQQKVFSKIEYRFTFIRLI